MNYRNDIQIEYQMFNYNRIPINMNAYNLNMYSNIQNINSEQNVFKFPQYQIILTIIQKIILIRKRKIIIYI